MFKRIDPDFVTFVIVIAAMVALPIVSVNIIKQSYCHSSSVSHSDDIHIKFMNEVKDDPDFEIFFESEIIKPVSVRKLVECGMAKLRLNKNAGSANIAIQITFNEPYTFVSFSNDQLNIYNINTDNTFNAFRCTFRPNSGYLSNVGTDIVLSLEKMQEEIIASGKKANIHNQIINYILGNINCFLDKTLVQVALRKGN